MTSTCTHAQDDWELYALGGLDREIEREMSAHLESGCEECRQQYFEVQDSLNALGGSAPLVKPSASAERKLMKRIHEDLAPANSASPFWKFAPWAVAFACLIVMLWLERDRARMQSELAQAQQQALRLQQNQQSLEAAEKSIGQSTSSAVSQPVSTARGKSKVEAELRAKLDQVQQQAQMVEAAREQAQQQIAQLQAQVAAATSRTTTLESELRSAEDRAAQSDSQKTQVLAAELAKSQAEVRRLSATAASATNNNDRVQRLLQSASLQQIDLRSVDAQGGHATARALYSPQGGLLVVADALPKLPEQKCYQVWLIKKSGPAITSAGLMTLQDDGKGMLFAPPSPELAEVTALAITDEPAGGSVSARGKKLLFGAQ